ncbi:MAG: hypothetical protein PHU46_17300 [Rhodocyclaceae bacterium]|nr:hypothetical protein [Rhodocyclaceae bacterium]
MSPSAVRLPSGLAIALSLILHLLVLSIPMREPRPPARPAKRLEASLAPRNPAPVADVPQPAARPRVKQSRRPILAMERPHPAAPSFSTPKWTEAEKAEMNEFLAETAREARMRPSLAQGALAMARELGRRQAEQEEGEGETLERLPNSPPVDPFGLEMYLDALVKKLNRSSAFVKDQRKKQGFKNASVRIRLNPDGSLESLKVLNMGDQQDEIEYVKAVVRQAVPFSAFPSDLKRSAGALSMLICIQPGGSGGGMGFSRMPAGKGC